MKRFLKRLLVIAAALSLTACVEPEEWVLLKKEQEEKVLSGETSAAAFWEKAYEIARKHNIPAEEQVMVIEMMQVGKSADEKVITLDEYRHVHRLTMAQFSQNIQQSRQRAAAVWAGAFQQQSQYAHERSLSYGNRRSINCTTTRTGSGMTTTNCY